MARQHRSRSSHPQETVDEIQAKVLTSGTGVGDRPSCLLSRLELSLAEDVDKDGEDVGVDHGLNLRAVSGSYVGNSPANRN